MLDFYSRKKNLIKVFGTLGSLIPHHTNFEVVSRSAISKGVLIVTHTRTIDTGVWKVHALFLNTSSVCFLLLLVYGLEFFCFFFK